MNELKASKIRLLVGAGAVTILASAALAAPNGGANGAANATARASGLAIATLTRVEVGPSVYGAVKLAKDLSGRPLLITLQEIAGEKQIQNLVAVDADGKTVGQMKVWSSQFPDKLLSIRDVGFNSRGELMVITGVGSNSSGDESLFSDNLTKNSSVPLISTGRSPQFGGRLTFKGHELVVATSDLNARTNTTDPSMVRVIDEDSGKVVSQTILDQNSEGELGIDSKGNLKVLIRGYELFGLIDVASGKYTNLIPPRQQPSVYPGTIELSIGKFVTLGDAKTQQLLNRKDLLDGIFRPVRTFPSSTKFIGEGGGKIPTLAIDATETSIRITNLKTGVALGPAIPVGSNGRVQTNVDDVMMSPAGLIALISSPKHPNSYVRGTILEYVNVKTGAVLRRAERDRDEAHGQLIRENDGRILTLEKVPSFSMDADPHFVIADLSTGKTLSSGDADLFSNASRSTSGRLFAMRADGEKLCALDLLDPKVESCVADSKVTADVGYGYQPFEVDGAVVTLPLLQKNSQNSDSVLGYTTIRVD